MSNVRSNPAADRRLSTEMDFFGQTRLPGPATVL